MKKTLIYNLRVFLFFLGLLILSILYCENINMELLNLFQLSEKKLMISHSNNETQQLNLKNIFTLLLKTTISIKELNIN
jgi:uncharacterized membrane protein